MTSECTRYIQMDEEGYFIVDQQRIKDQERGHTLLTNLKIKPLSGYSSFDGEDIYVEAYDAPLIVHELSPGKDDLWEATSAYDYNFKFSLKSLTLDEWDRFLGYDTENRPFVLTPKAQAIFFDTLDEFDDDSITFNKVCYELTPWLKTKVSTESSDFWDKKYQTEETPGWELSKVSVPLAQSIPQLKIPRCRILVPGCGSGNDAAHLASLGHIVTAIDFSNEAISLAQQKYGHIKNLKFEKADIFNLPENYHQAFDLIVEHTLFCAVPTEKRDELVKKWRKCLVSNGHILMILFVMEQKTHPPFGGSEWEYRQRLQKNFRFLYWTRWKKSEEWRVGTELVIYAQLKENI